MIAQSGHIRSQEHGFPPAQDDLATPTSECLTCQPQTPMLSPQNGPFFVGNLVASGLRWTPSAPGVFTNLLRCGLVTMIQGLMEA